jgi:preprotein translocase subunit SecA
MLNKIVSFFFGSKHQRDIKKLLPLVAQINALEPTFQAMNTDEFPKKTQEFKDRLKSGESLDDILPEAFGLVREAARRALGERPYDVQLLGGIVLHQGKITEMKTGEGKTLSSVGAAYLNSLTGNGVHMVTVNDYLAERDAKWMEPVYASLGVSVGYVLSNMDTEARKLAYGADITYATNNELGFDYLRDNMKWDTNEKAQRSHAYCIVDEIDSILIDESRTPLIISGQVDDDTSKYGQVDGLVNLLTECEKDPETDDYPEEPVGDYKLDEKSKRVLFTDQGMNKVEEILQNRKIISGSLFAENNFEYIHYVSQAMRAHLLFNKDVDYVVQDGKVEIVDEFTGRILHGRRYSEGLHQAIEAKERIKVAKQNKTIATITFQNFFRLYDKLSGMTGTADTEAKEFTKIYGMDVVVVPTNRPVARDDQNDTIYFNEKFKYDAIVKEIREANQKGQPVLVGTVSIEKSEVLAKHLTRAGIRHEILNAKNHHREALIIAEAGAKGSVTIATNMAGRGTDIKLGGNPEFRARRKAGTEASDEEYKKALETEMKSWRKDYEEVKSLGGLFVLGTERHESRRIDNQLRGRSGRQGDPGRSKFFLSLDDTLMRLFANDSIRGMMGKLGMADGEPIEHPWINKSVENAQKRVEERNFDIRKHLLDYDDVLSMQRKLIYSQRDSILGDTKLVERILKTADELLDDILEPYRKQPRLGAHTTAIMDELKEAFFYEESLNTEDAVLLTIPELRERVLDHIQKDLNEKNTKVTPERLNMYIRFEYLRKIDQNWQQHLDNMEALREAVSLRSYAQKNPLLEYKLEGSDIFNEMIEDIRIHVAKKIIRVRIEKAPASGQRRGGGQVRANHSSMSGFGALQNNQRKEATGQKVQIRRTVPKVGRNDPCPCGLSDPKLVKDSFGLD